jgi:CheY-like chemotaxis protein
MKTVLVVDDDRDTNEVTCRLLRKLGHQALSAHTGEEALAIVAMQIPDLIILDSMMPGMNGAEVLRLLRAKVETATIPVIMHSAIAEEEFQVNAIAKGANEYLVKAGFTFERFKETIAKYI